MKPYNIKKKYNHKQEGIIAFSRYGLDLLTFQFKYINKD